MNRRNEGGREVRVFPANGLGSPSFRRWLADPFRCFPVLSKPQIWLPHPLLLSTEGWESTNLAQLQSSLQSQSKKNRRSAKPTPVNRIPGFRLVHRQSGSYSLAGCPTSPSVFCLAMCDSPPQIPRTRELANPAPAGANLLNYQDLTRSKRENPFPRKMQHFRAFLLWAKSSIKLLINKELSAENLTTRPKKPPRKTP